MTKQHYKETCADFGVNPRALKELFKKDGLKVKALNKLDVLNKIFIHSGDLIYCRSVGRGAIEYLDTDLPMRLTKAMRDAKGGNNEY